MIGIFLGVGAFFGIMIPTLLISAMPGLTIKVIELFKVYKPGTLTTGTSDYITGAGYYRQGKVFIYRDESGKERFESGRVFGKLVLIFIPIFFIFSALAFFVFQIFL
ncbi:MAG: hypothetical protein NTU73_04535 [Ignavibacteriae bacterium]|nr:hypothetical protein [Ignavibacteriota bacterium]